MCPDIFQEEGMPIDLNPRRTRMKDPKWHKPNPVHAALAEAAKADREIRPAQ